MTYRQSDKPHLHPIEQGRMLHPPYETDLHAFEVKTDEWDHVCSCRFGEARGKRYPEDGGWTGDSYRYDIFVEKIKRLEQQRFALRWWNGSGEGWMLCEHMNPGSRSVLSIIADIPDEPTRWDAVHGLWQAAEKSALAAAHTVRHELFAAFCEKRLRKRRRKGKYYMEIAPRVLAPAPAQ